MGAVANEKAAAQIKKGMHMTLDKKLGACLFALVGAVALFGIGGGVGRAQGLACNPGTMLGRWRAQVVTDAPWDATVDLMFEFHPDGTYVYTAGQGSFRWTSHAGRYAIGQNGGESARSYPCLIRLTPDPSTIRNNQQNKLGLMPLLARSLMADDERTFRIQPLGGRLVLHDTELNWRDVGMFSIERAN
jgi:hypothetical protein